MNAPILVVPTMTPSSGRRFGHPQRSLTRTPFVGAKVPRPGGVRPYALAPPGRTLRVK
jgi:hypothetical protein